MWFLSTRYIIHANNKWFSDSLSQLFAYSLLVWVFLTRMPPGIARQWNVSLAHGILHHKLIHMPLTTITSTLTPMLPLEGAIDVKPLRILSSTDQG